MQSSNNNHHKSENDIQRFRFDSDYNFGKSTSSSNALDPQRLLSIALRYKWIIILLLIAGAGGAWYYAENATPVYEANGTILIETPAGGQDDRLSQLMNQTTGEGLSTTLANQIQVFKSRSFARQVSQSLMDQDSLTISDYPILWTYDEENKEFYRANEATVTSRIQRNLAFNKPEEKADVLDVSFTSKSPKQAAKIVNNAMEVYVEQSTEQNREAASKTAEFLKKEKEAAKEELRKAEEKLRSYMNSSGIVQVDEQAANIVNRREETEAEIERVKLDLKTTEETIEKYEQRLEEIKPGLSKQYSEALEPRIQNLQEEMAQYEKERRLIIARNPGVLDRKPLPDRLQYLNKQIEKVKNEITELSSKLFNEDNEFTGISSEDRAQAVTEIQNRLVDLKIQQNQYKSRLEALREHKKEIDSTFNSLPEGKIELAKLQRDVKLKEELYLNLSKQYSDMSLFKQSQFGYGQIIDKASVPSSPVWPNKKILLLLGLMLGGFLSAAFIATREFMNNTVNSLNQLKNIYQPSFNIITIPKIEKKSQKRLKSFKGKKDKIPNELVMMQDSLNIVSESVRRLMNYIIFQNGDTPPKTVAVTSPAKGDGKSTIVSNLGIAFSEAGYNTLLIDVDLRRPKLHKYLGLSSKQGLTDYFGGNLPISNLVKSTDINSSLSVITTGSTSKNHESIIGTSKFKELIDNLQRSFDIILFDTPPFGIISDSTAVLKYSQSTIVVARYQETNKGLLFRTIDELEQIQANVTNIVLNEFDYRKETENYYGAGYFEALYENYSEYAS
ncbi:GumC family protein [Fodinibius sp.]|uniref:GumC family protein n=1 Tax=Fodinibius sp. TaxID=1872440 RepID=UPI002ACE9286|nr:polysaccharide biosynthesis tyrosine autokinase [Fodinibius sp.]MDZ7659245.1 polysaccharide biosynthesis tyrosine autokinase [Fodinibius sp.]